MFGLVTMEETTTLQNITVDSRWPKITNSDGAMFFMKEETSGILVQVSSVMFEEKHYRHSKQIKVI